MRTIKANTKANGDILPEPKFKRIPVRVDKNTIILVREGLNVEEHLKRFKDKDNTPRDISRGSKKTSICLVFKKSNQYD